MSACNEQIASTSGENQSGGIVAKQNQVDPVNLGVYINTDYGLKLEHYCNSLLVTGYPESINTAYYRTILKELGGLWHGRLKVGKGWLYPIAKWDAIRDFITTGLYKGAVPLREAEPVPNPLWIDYQTQKIVLSDRKRTLSGILGNLRWNKRMFTAHQKALTTHQKALTKHHKALTTHQAKCHETDKKAAKLCALVTLHTKRVEETSINMARYKSFLDTA
jgi:hypothetical protein